MCIRDRAYRNIKANGGSYTAGTDNRNISDIGCLPPETVVEKVRFIVTILMNIIKKMLRKLMLFLRIIFQ